MEQIHINDGLRLELRSFLVQLSAWQTVERELSEWKADAEDRRLIVAAIMGSVYLEAFLNNIIEFYRRSDFENFDQVGETKERIVFGIRVLDPELVPSSLSGWAQVCELIKLRNSIVHNKVTSRIVENGSITQENQYALNFQRADTKVLAVKYFVLALHKHLKWNGRFLEGQFRNKVQQRFDSFFKPFLPD
ncbi:MAG: hypothetical protein AAB865_00460 [Patescibacteria group bacterium]